MLRIRAAPKDNQAINNGMAAPEGGKKQGSLMSVKKGAGHSVTLSEPDWRKSRLRWLPKQTGKEKYKQIFKERKT